MCTALHFWIQMSGKELYKAIDKNAHNAKELLNNKTDWKPEDINYKHDTGDTPLHLGTNSDRFFSSFVFPTNTCFLGMDIVVMDRLVNRNAYLLILQLFWSCVFVETIITFGLWIILFITVISHLLKEIIIKFLLYAYNYYLPLLFSASSSGLQEIVELLLSKGALINIKGGLIGDTPLHRACEWGYSPIVQLLLQHQSSANNDINSNSGNIVSLKDDEGNTPLHRAIDHNQPLEMIQLLLQHDSTVIHSKNQRGETPFHRAVYNCGSSNSNSSSSLIDLFINNSNYNVDINEQDNDGNTALHIATKNGQSDVVSMLLIAGAQVDVTNKDGVTPLQCM